MSFRVIDNPDFKKFKTHSGFSNAEFKQLASLFMRASSVKALYDIGVDVNFDDGTCTFTYYQSSTYKPFLQFVIRRVGPRTNMYELWQQDKGKVMQSGLFERTFEKLEKEVEALFPDNS